MSRIIDITVPLRPGMIHWPDSSEFRLESYMSLDRGDQANVSRFECDSHAGTHIDAPYHFTNSGLRVDELPLTTLIGQALVADLRDVDKITADDLEDSTIPADCQRLLLLTSNSELWRRADRESVPEFTEDFVALTLDGAQWVVERGIGLIGIDYLSIQRYQNGPDVHKLLLEAGVVIVESLNLSGVSPGSYELLCLPLNIIGAEGAPARAVLRTLPEEE